MPKAGVSRREYRTKKFGSWERSQELDAKMVAVGETEGIQFALDRIERTPNTLDAHRLIWLAGENGVQDAVVEALFRAYFTEGKDISKRETLLDVVAEAGLDRDQAEGVLNSNEGMQAIREAHEQSRRIGVDGVPFFIINAKLTLSGAQPPEAFLEAFGEALLGATRWGRDANDLVSLRRDEALVRQVALGDPSLSRLDRLVVRILTDVQSLLLNVLFC
jgi:predicted DsbA family dithiol-disulfide isomerase